MNRLDSNRLVRTVRASTRLAGVRGASTFVADLAGTDALHLEFVRSTMPAASIRGIDCSQARALDGVVAVLTAEDLDLEPVWEIHIIPDSLGQPPLASGVVRYVGERVAAVVATSREIAIDAAELVEVTYTPLPALTSAVESSADGARHVHDGFASNAALEWSHEAGELPDPETSVVVDGWMTMPRVAVAPMEGLAMLAVPGEDGLTLYASTQSPFATRVQTARSLRMPLEQIRVVTPAVGGGFGGKSLGGVVDYAVTAAAAMKLGRPVVFVEDRGANLTTMHGRGVSFRYRALATDDGDLVGLDVQEWCDAGAYPSTNAVEPGKSLMMLCGPYRVDNVRFRAASLMTNLPPSGAYRGPGRSEITAVVEQALDRLARRLHLDPFDLRVRNALDRTAFPRTTPTGASITEADPFAVLDAIGPAYGALRDEQARLRRDQPTRAYGVGLALAMDSAAWFSRTDDAHLRVLADGRVQIFVGSAASGQHHDDLYKLVVAPILGVDVSAIDVVAGDTASSAGPGSSGSRTTQVIGGAVVHAAEQVVENAKAIAASLLECAPVDVAFDGGRFFVRGVPARSLGWVDLHHAVPADADAELDATCTFAQGEPTHPMGAHAALVSVDLETGRTDVHRHVSHVAAGRIIDPPSAHGQVVGAVAQAIGQILFEEAAYDNGTPLSVNFADYALPGATEVPAVESHFLADVSASNPLGAKGVGEVGMVAGPAAVFNAVLDALAPLGVDDLPIPCTPKAVWAALRAAADAGAQA